MKIVPLASGSSGNAYYISDGVTSLLLDAGLPLAKLRDRLYAHGLRLTDVDGCLVSHCHGDHSAGIRGLIKLGIPVSTSRGTVEKLNLEGLGGIHTVHSGGRAVIGTFFITAFYIQHDAPESLGFLVESIRTNERLAYITDTMYCPFKFPPLDYLMCECNYTESGLCTAVDDGITPTCAVPRIVKTHMSLTTLTELLDANDIRRLKKVYVLHLSDRNSDEQEVLTQVRRHAGGAEVEIC